MPEAPAPETPLSNDELTCLYIMALGKPVLPIGRWEPAVNALIARGFAKLVGAAGAFITEKGRQVAQETEDAILGEFIEKSGAIQ